MSPEAYKTYEAGRQARQAAREEVQRLAERLLEEGDEATQEVLLLAQMILHGDDGDAEALGADLAKAIVYSLARLGKET